MANNQGADPNANNDGNLEENGGQGQGQNYEEMYNQLLAESRKWESRSKANKAKADKYDALVKENSNVEERIAALEKENQDMKESAARRKLVSKVASEVGLSAELVASLNGSDEKTLMAQAKAIADLKPTGAPHVPEAGKFERDGGSGGDSEDEQKRQFVRQLFGKE